MEQQSQPTTTMAPSLHATALQGLKDSLKSSDIFTPDSEGYQDALRRWSETGIKPAVCAHQSTAKPFL